MDVTNSANSVTRACQRPRQRHRIPELNTMSSSRACRTVMLVLSLLYLLCLIPLSSASCTFFNESGVDYDLDTETSLPHICNALDESKKLFIFPDKVNNVDNISVCFNVTNVTSVMDATSLQSYFIEYRPEMDEVKLTKLNIFIHETETPKCKSITIENSYNDTLQFGVYIPQHCFWNKRYEKICPLKLDILGKSCTLLYGTTLEVREQNQKSLEKDILKTHVNNLEKMCVDLNIKIEIPETATCTNPESSSVCSLPSRSKVMAIELGIIFGAFSVFVIAAVVAAVCYRQKRKNKRALSTERELDICHTNYNSPGSLILPTFCGTKTSTINHSPNNVVTLAIDESHDYEELYFKPASREEELVTQIKKLGITEISREQKSLRLLEVLGSGAFGTVHRAVWLHSGSSSEQQLVEQEVAVKSMDGVTSEEERVKFLQEAAIMGQFNHPNIIKILGIVSDTPMMILIGIMKAGDLRKHLLDIKMKNSAPQELPPSLLSYSRQVASGMVYLSIKGFIHRDLAARNILVSDSGTCKIADFGLSRDLQDATYYKSHGGKIPVKWTAPEALNYHKYSTASDVWSYGCVLYEIWSLGYKPFHGNTNTEAIRKVGTGFRLPPPPGCPRAIYDIIIQCWHPKAAQRPSFFDVTVSLQKPDFMLLQWSNEEINICSEEATTLRAPLEAGHQLHMDLQKTYVVGAEQETSLQQDRESAEPSQSQDDDKQIEIDGLYKVLESNDEVDESYAENNVGEDSGNRIPAVGSVEVKLDLMGM